MMRLDKKLLKNNIKFIGIMAVVTLVLILVETISNHDVNFTSSLGNNPIKINKLVINEIMTSNSGAYSDEEGNTYDWVELYNGTSKDINLSGYGLSDDASGRVKWIFPDVTIKKHEYLIVYLSGTSKEGLYANFSLKKEGGETLTLKKKSGKVADSVKILSIDKNTTMARNSDGKWVQTKDITPGFDNNKTGREKYLKERVSEEKDAIVISEFLPDNKGNVNFDGKFYSYIELLNTSDKDVSLKNYFVSNDLNRPFQWRLPDVTLKPNEVYLIYTSDLNKDNNANFVLKKKTGSVILSKAGKVLEEYDYENLTGGFAYIRSSDGNLRIGTNITPGYPNTEKGMENYSNDLRKNPNDLIINEIMSSNNTYLAQNGNEYYDWIELYNNTNHKINLSEYSITNDEDFKKMYVLPDVELKSGEYYVIMASGDTSLSNSKYEHANFKISQSESIYLYKDDKLIDSVFVSNIPKGYSYGRDNKNGFYYYSKPSPLSKNSGNAVQEIAYDPTFSKNPGVYNDVEEISVELEGAGTIYYTLDGSEPTKSSKVYNSPIILKKTSVIRAVSYESGKKESGILTGSYIINENHTLPVISLSLPESSFSKIVKNPNNTKLTVSAHAELYEKDKSFSIDCGLKLFGGQTRFIPKKSFAIKFTSDYGPSKLKYKVFDNRDAVSYDQIVIRSGSQDSVGSMIRDELATSIMDDYGTVDVQAYKAVVLYINGNYWGVYFLREKVDDTFVSHHYDVPTTGTNIVRIDSNVSEGSAKDYYALRSYILNHNMASSENYEYVKTKLDIDNFIDYWIGELYTTNNDIVNTRFFNNPKVDGGKIKMIFYDFDYAFYNYSRNYLQWMTASGGMGEHNFDNTILRGLLQNKEFKQRFIERASYNLKNVWTEEHIMDRYNELVKLIEPEMKRNQERWNKTYSDWQKGLDELKKYLNVRRSYMISNLKSYFSLSSEEVKKYFE